MYQTSSSFVEPGDVRFAFVGVRKLSGSRGVACLNVRPVSGNFEKPGHVRFAFQCWSQEIVWLSWCEFIRPVAVRTATRAYDRGRV